MISCSAVQLRPRKWGPNRTVFTYFDAVAERIAKLQHQSSSRGLSVYKKILASGISPSGGRMRRRAVPGSPQSPRGGRSPTQLPSIWTAEVGVGRGAEKNPHGDRKLTNFDVDV